MDDEKKKKLLYQYISCFKSSFVKLMIGVIPKEEIERIMLPLLKSKPNSICITNNTFIQDDVTYLWFISRIILLFHEVQ